MKRRLLALTAGLLLVPLAACDIDQTEEGELPDVDVEVSEGELPEYDVDGPDVDIGTDTDTVIVETPTIDVDLPDEDDDTTGVAN